MVIYRYISINIAIILNFIINISAILWLNILIILLIFKRVVAMFEERAITVLHHSIFYLNLNEQ